MPTWTGLVFYTQFSQSVQTIFSRLFPQLQFTRATEKGRQSQAPHVSLQQRFWRLRGNYITIIDARFFSYAGLLFFFFKPSDYFLLSLQIYN